MKLLNPESLARDLENGIAEPRSYFEVIPEEYRLRLPICGVVSLAIARALEEAGHSITVVHSQPKLPFDPHESHVFPIVHTETSDTIIDATYGAFLRFAGLTPEGILLGEDTDMYPEQKILTFEVGDSDYPSAMLSVAALRALVAWRPHPTLPSRSPDFDGMSAGEIRETLSEFWNPAHFQDFKPTRATLHEGRRLARYIQDTSIRLGD